MIVTNPLFYIDGQNSNKKVQQGRIIIPKEWGNISNTEVFISFKREKIGLYPRVPKMVDSVKVDDLLSDPHELKRKAYSNKF